MNYRYLSFEDRRSLEQLYSQGVRPSDIASSLNVHTATIYRELEKGYTGKLTESGCREYSAELAQKVFQNNLKQRGKDNRITLEKLSQISFLNEEIKRDTERQERLYSELLAAKTASYNDMPRTPAFENLLERKVAEIIDLEAKITQSRNELNRLEMYIDKIPDNLTKRIFRLRFGECMSWVQIALCVGGGNTEDGVRKRVFRYIEQEKQ